MATPYCGLEVSLMMDQSTGTDHARLTYLQHDVPLKGKTPLSMWALCWPMLYLRENDVTPTAARARFLRDLQKGSIPLGTEQKYQHTIEFFDRVMATRRWPQESNGNPSA